MSKRNISINMKLAAIALILGVIAIFFGNPTNSNDVKFNSKDLAMLINDKSSSIDVYELADKLIKGNVDFVLVDLCEEQNFSEYHIPSSVNLAVQDLNPDNLLRNQKIIIYAEDNFKAAQAWFLLKAKGYKGVYLLKGGMTDWKDKILFPKLAVNASPDEIRNFEKIKEVSKFFGGQPQIGGTETSESPKIKMPPPQMSSQPVIKRKGKPKKEGC